MGSGCEPSLKFGVIHAGIVTNKRADPHVYYHMTVIIGPAIARSFLPTHLHESAPLLCRTPYRKSCSSLKPVFFLFVSNFLRSHD